MVDAWFDDLGKHWRVNCGRCGGGCGWHKERDGAITAWNARPAPAEPGAGVVPVECWAVLDPDGNIDIDNVWRSDEMAEWASELHGVEKIRVRITPIATPKERPDVE